MKHLGAIVVGIAGIVLGGIAWRAEAPTYSAPKSFPAPPELVPAALTGVVPPGCVVRTFDVEGMCCGGCPGRLYVRLEELDQVAEAAVDPVAKQAKVVVPVDFDVARVEAALTFDKYTAHLSH